MDPDLIVENILQFELEPPDEEYSTYDYGGEIAASLPRERRLPLIREVLVRLPASMARTFLDGLFDVPPVYETEDDLRALFGIGGDVASTAVLIEILSTRFQVEPDSIVQFLLSKLTNEKSDVVQDQLAFSMWVLFNSETLLVREDKVIGYLVTPVNTSIDKLVNEATLTEYARTTLEKCKVTIRLDSQSGNP